MGELLTFLASVNYTGTSSMEIGIKVRLLKTFAPVVRHANSCFFTMVAVSDDGKPTAVLCLNPDTADEKRRFEAAKLRRQLRQELERRFRPFLLIQRTPCAGGSTCCPSFWRMAKENRFTCSECGGHQPQMAG